MTWASSDPTIHCWPRHCVGSSPSTPSITLSLSVLIPYVLLINTCPNFRLSSTAPFYFQPFIPTTSDPSQSLN